MLNGYHDKDLRGLYEGMWLNGYRDQDSQATDALLYHFVHDRAPKHLPTPLQGKVVMVDHALPDDTLTGFVTGRTGDCMIAIQSYRGLSSDLANTNPCVTDIDGFEGTGRALTKDHELVPASILFTGKNPNYVLKGILDLEMLRRVSELTRNINLIRESVGRDPIRGASNVTRFLLERRNFAAEIIIILEQYELPPSQCTLELLEDVGQLTPHQIDQLKVLERAGIMISMDDFGEAGSEATFEQLTRAGLRIGEIKFDGAMTRSIGQSDKRRHVVDLLTTAYNHGVHICVWEGDVQGIDQSHITAAQQVNDAFRQSHPEMQFVFEGSITPA